MAAHTLVLEQVRPWAVIGARVRVKPEVRLKLGPTNAAGMGGEMGRIVEVAVMGRASRRCRIVWADGRTTWSYARYLIPVREREA